MVGQGQSFSFFSKENIQSLKDRGRRLKKKSKEEFERIKAGSKKALREGSKEALKYGKVLGRRTATQVTKDIRNVGRRDTSGNQQLSNILSALQGRPVKKKVVRRKKRTVKKKVIKRKTSTIKRRRKTSTIRKRKK